MPTFTQFAFTLPDPNNKIGQAGQTDASGTAGPGFASVKISSNEPTMIDNINQTGAYHQKWMIDITYNPMTCEEFDTVYAFLRQRKAEMAAFYVSLPQYLNQGTTYKTLTTEVPIGDSQLLVDDTNSNPVVASVGDLFYFTFSGREKRFMVTRVETNSEYLDGSTQPAATEERIHFYPPVQEIMTSTSAFGESIAFDSLIKVFQVGDVHEYKLNSKGLFQFSLKLEEAIN